MYSYRGHLVGDNAAWVGVNWYNAFAVTNPDGTPYDLTGYTATATVRSYPGGPSFFTMTPAIDAPATAGTGTLTILGASTATKKPGKYSYQVTLTPASPSITKQPIVLYGDIELRNR